MQRSGGLDYWAGMAPRTRKLVSDFREDADRFRSLSQFVSGDAADALVEGAAVLDAKASKLERRARSLFRLGRKRAETGKTPAR
jgi:hypothetical protein